MKHTRKIVWMLGLTLAATLALTAAPAALAAGGPPEGRGRAATGTAARGIGVVGDPMTEEQVEHLVAFWEDEHKALAIYEEVMADFGEIQPFVSIANAERQHIAALERIFVRYDVALPEVPEFDAPSFETPEAAAEAAAQAEIDNADLYETWMAAFTQPDVLRVMENLHNASLENHLPAFEAFAAGELTCDGECLGTPGTAGQGRGMWGDATTGRPGRGRMNAEPRLNCVEAGTVTP